MVAWVGGWWREAGRRDYKRDTRIGGAGHVDSLDCSDGVAGIYMYQNLLRSWILNICS